MRASIVLGPVLDVLAPADLAAAGRRVRNAAIFLAIAAWLLPSHPPLGTDSAAHRAAICAAFVAAAVAAQFRHAHRWARIALPVAACAAAAIVAWCGSGALWGLGFVVYAVLVLAATEQRIKRFPPALPDDEPDPLPPRSRLVPRVLAWYAWFCISAAVVSHWVMQIMYVPTASMQPTIMADRTKQMGQMCDVLLVDKTPYLRHDPRRWEIVVFECPYFPSVYLVKRLIGLPGERVEIKDGDIWINGQVAKKPPLVQETMWREEFPRAVTSSSFGAAKEIQQGWLEERAGSGGGWKKIGPNEVRGKSAGLFFSRKLESPDVRVSFDVRTDDVEFAVWTEITSRGVPVNLTLPRSGGNSGLRIDGKNVTDGAEPSGAPGSDWRRMELTVVDGDAWWSLDGKASTRQALPARRRGDTRVSIGVSGEATFRNLRVESDVFYKSDVAGASWDVPNDGFFFLGDNVAGSDDSRRWTALSFKPQGGGPAILAAATVPDAITGQPHNQIRIDGNVQRFVDVDGVPRALPRDTASETIAIPFARRSHIVGRAVMIVFPWTVAEAGFRPRLLP